MIRFENVSKVYHLARFNKTVLTNVTMTINRGEALAVCGANGAGKSTMMRLIAGVEHPTTGIVRRDMVPSWPIGYSSCFQSTLTGADNARFIARIYRKPIKELLDFVEDFAQLGPYFKQPIRTYSAGMLARLAFGVSLAIDFDCYLVDEVTSAGDDRFRQRCREALMKRRDTGTLVMISHDPAILLEYCTRGAVVRDGGIRFFDTVEEALADHHAAQAQH